MEDTDSLDSDLVRASDKEEQSDSREMDVIVADGEISRTRERQKERRGDSLGELRSGRAKVEEAVSGKIY